MGKVWTRDGKANQRETSAGTQTPRFHTHRPTVWTRSAQQSQKAVPVGNQNRVRTAPVPQSTWDDANGPAAKRRRLAAKGRLPPSLTTAQNGAASSPGQQQAVKEAAAASEPQLSAWRAAKAAKEAQREAALLQEAAALRRRIAEEEAKLAAAKVQPFKCPCCYRAGRNASNTSMSSTCRPQHRNKKQNKLLRKGQSGRIKSCGRTGLMQDLQR